MAGVVGLGFGPIWRQSGRSEVKGTHARDARARHSMHLFGIIWLAICWHPSSMLLLSHIEAFQREINRPPKTIDQVYWSGAGRIRLVRPDVCFEIGAQLMNTSRPRLLWPRTAI
jgi:hypothetical protein